MRHMHTWRQGVWLALMGWCVLVPAVAAQRTVLGANPSDRVLLVFLNQQSNASNLLAGLNAYAPSGLTWVEALVPKLVTNLSLASPALRGDAVLTNAATLTLLSDALIRLATNSFLLASNGWQLKDDTGARLGNWKLTTDAETLARYGDVSNIVELVESGQGEWVSLTWLDTSQFGTNEGAVVLKDGALATNFSALGMTLAGGLVANVAAKGSNYTLTATDYFIAGSAASSNIVLTLPAAATAERVYEFKKTDATANTVTVDGNGAETIEGATTVVLSNQWQYLRLVSDGAQWLIAQ